MNSKLIVLVLIVISVQSAKLPSYIKVCKRNDPNISNCIKDSFESIKEYLGRGIPELNVPSIEPFHLDKIYLTQNINLNISNVQVYGPSKVKVIDFKAEMQKLRFAFVLKFSCLQLTGNYDMDMKLLSIPLKGTGRLRGNLTNFETTGTVKARKSVQNGVEYIKFYEPKLKIYPGHSQLELDNLFNNRGELTHATNKLINENSDMFMQELIPALETSIATKLLELGNKIITKLPYDVLFPL